MKPLRVRKVADKSQGDRIKRFNPDTGEPYLLNPATGQPEPWPCRGLEIVDEQGSSASPPRTTRVPTKWVVRGVAEGWLELRGSNLVHRPGGPVEDPYRITHTFTHADQIVLITVPGEADIVYDVTHQPDKYADPGTDKTPVSQDMYSGGATRVDHFYDLRLSEESRS